MSGILVVTDQTDGEVRRSSLEALTESARLAHETKSKVTALIVGNRASQCVPAASRYGANHIFLVEDPELGAYWPEAYRDLTLDAVRKSNPSIVLFSATSTGRDLAPRVAVRLDCALASDCISLELVDGSLEAMRPMYAGKVRAKVRLKSRPALASLRPNVFQARESPSAGDPVLEKLEWNPQTQPRSKPVRMVESETKKMDLTEARVIVSGGRGMQGPENYKLLEQLANVLGGVVGASRAAVDSGWRPHSDQVGQTGRVVTPDLYIACGISGAIQHKVGMMNAKTIIAINKDPDAPIFQLADYGLVGDLFEIVPALTEEFRKVLGKS